MHVVLGYSAEVSLPFSEDFFQRIASRTLEACHFPFLAEKTIGLNAVAVLPERIRELNSTYRKHKSVTDILSFSEYESKGALQQAREKKIFLGQIFFCPRFIRTMAEKDGVTFEREMVYVFSHGVLHLVGFDHEEKMFAIQESVTDIFHKNSQAVKK